MSKIFLIKCDDCGTSTFLGLNQNLNVHELVKKNIIDGWLLGGDYDLCPACRHKKTIQKRLSEVKDDNNF